MAPFDLQRAANASLTALSIFRLIRTFSGTVSPHYEICTHYYYTIIKEKVKKNNT
nr:MAG TPA: hypothetical protein [Caudoviricetes sp.]